MTASPIGASCADAYRRSGVRTFGRPIRAGQGATAFSGATMPTVVHVAGLTAERVEAGHLDGLCRLDGDRRVMETLGGPT